MHRIVAPRTASAGIDWIVHQWNTSMRINAGQVKLDLAFAILACLFCAGKVKVRYLVLSFDFLQPIPALALMALRSWR